MGDQQHGLAGLALDPHQLDIHALARHGVERAERLVHQHDLGIVHQRPADRGALLHAAGQLPGQLLLKAFEPDQLQQRLRARQIFLARQPLHVDRQHDVGEDVAPRQQQRVLEHDADIAVRLVDLLALDQDFAGRRRQQPGDHFQQRGLAAAGRADHDKELAGIDMKVERPQRRHVAVARPVGFRHAGQAECRACAAAARSDTTRRCAPADCESWSPRSFAIRSNHAVIAGAMRRSPVAALGMTMLISADSHWCKTPSDCPWPWHRGRHIRPSD